MSRAGDPCCFGFKLISLAFRFSKFKSARFSYSSNYNTSLSEKPESTAYFTKFLFYNSIKCLTFSLPSNITDSSTLSPGVVSLFSIISIWRSTDYNLALNKSSSVCDSLLALRASIWFETSVATLNSLVVDSNSPLSENESTVCLGEFNMFCAMLRWKL